MSDYKNQIRSMSFNIRYDNPEDGINGWKYRKDMVADMICFHRTDIAGLQEVLNNQMNDLKELLPEYGWIGVGRDDGKLAGEFAPIIFLKERFETINQGVFWLSQTPFIPGSMGWDAACTRITTWAEFTDKLTGEIFFFFNTHFDHVGAQAMRESSCLLQDMIEKIAEEKPVIVTGDFNNTEDSEAYRILTGKYSIEAASNKSLRDSKYACSREHHGPSITFHDFEAAEYLYYISKMDSYKNNELYMRKFQNIDYVFIKNNFHVLSHGTLADNWDGRYPSDHMPVVADLKYGEGN